MSVCFFAEINHYVSDHLESVMILQVVLLAPRFQAAKIKQILYQPVQAIGFVIEKLIALLAACLILNPVLRQSSVIVRKVVSGERNSCETAETKSD